MTVPGGAQSLAEPKAAPAKVRMGRLLFYAGLALFLLAAVSEVTRSPELTSSGTFGAALRLAIPIGLAGVGAIYSERTGIINIGLEGMMILGTWFGAWAGWQWGPWWGVAFGVAGGALGGLLHALATVTFAVDQIVSGVAINILALGGMRFLSVIAYPPGSGGGASQSPRVAGSIDRVSLPFASGGTLFGWKTPDFFGWLELQDWFFVSDFGALLRGMTGDLSWLTVLSVLLVPATWWVLWRTPRGLQLRSVGENPWAAESLGVPVYTMKYIGVTISGALAGLGGAILVLESAGIYREGQTGGRGFIGLAAMIFGNWRPGGVAAGAGLFGFADALQLRSEQAVHALLLYVAVALIVVAVAFLLRRRFTQAAWLGIIGIGFLVWFMVTDTVPRQFVFFTPHVVTLLVLGFASQRLRMPAADGVQYRKGEQAA